ncbi:MAG: Xylose isomerase domain protein barrel, partial [Phycisphaerales bacterium]|nr:Xylose isomerase domain protein barrel [Phycisphaerales bacterium]
VDSTAPSRAGGTTAMHSNLTRRDFVASSFAAIACAALGTRVSSADDSAPAGPHAAFPFYVMDTGLVGPDVATLEDKVKLAKDLGFSGIDYSLNHEQLPHLLELLDKATLELTAVYTSPFIENPFDPKLPDTIKLLKGRPTRIEMALQSKKFKQSDPAGDGEGLALVNRVSDLCGDTGPVVSIYPHTGAWAERVDDGVRLAKASGRKNVGANFNLVHWKWVKQQRTQEELLKEALPHLFLVSINGLAGNAIVPLDQGDYDVAAFLLLLQKVGYHGRVGLQGYGIKGPSREHLGHSMKKWRQMMAEIHA